jgi:hypothetical protein
MPTASVYGAHHEVNYLQYSNEQAYKVALNLTARIDRGILRGSIIPQPDNVARPGSAGVYEYVRTRPGSVDLPGNYGVTIINASNVSIGGSSAAQQSVVGGSGNIMYTNDHKMASGTIVLGDGSDVVSIGGANRGNWDITTGNGNGAIIADNAGDDTITAGLGHDLIDLGSGHYEINIQGGDTTITGGNSGLLSFLQDRVLTSTQHTYGNASLFGSLLTNIKAGLGNTSLGGPVSNDETVFDLVNGVGSGGRDYISNFPAGVTVDLSGFDPAQINYAISHPRVQGGETTVTLDDKTSITFDNATFKASKFTLN